MTNIINTVAAYDLLLQAIQEKQSTFNLLLQTAYRLDSTIDTSTIEFQYRLQQHETKQKERTS
jgi:hypothetical protein